MISETDLPTGGAPLLDRFGFYGRTAVHVLGYLAPEKRATLAGDIAAYGRQLGASAL
ncbi:hypothetical protein AT5A_25025 [Agrobacterium tumefaciens 5A]|nr:hypothetical protein AT5A_25025 [Agrobacterium tumefaciens 5A]